MNQSDVIELPEVPARSIREYTALLFMLAVVAVMVAAAMVLSGATDDGTGKHRLFRLPLAGAAAPAAPDTAAQLAPELAFKPISREDAETENALRPVANRPLEIAPPFVFNRTADNAAEWEKAVHCLELANYYEAASEGIQGMRAVSQVVLNRVRHPAFPKSICEVVFQGSERATGCQFTFTCDGALARPPVPSLMASARAVAMMALAGRVEASVGMATHYHANWVVPYWADNMDKIRNIGRHIFYLWRGSWGNRSAFRGVYRGETGVDPAALLAALPVAADAAPAADAVPLISLTTKPGAAGKGKRPPERTNLVADEPAGSLKADEAGHLGVLQAPALPRSESEGIANHGQ